MSLNSVPVAVVDHVGLLSKFPEQYREQLKMYTGEELFYVYKIATLKVRRNKAGDIPGSDMFFLSLKYKLFRWLKGETCQCLKHGKKHCGHGINPMAWAKLGSRFKQEFYGYVVECVYNPEQDSTAA